MRGIKDVAIVSSIISGAILVAFAGIAIIGFLNFSQNPFEPVVATGQTVIGSIGSVSYTHLKKALEEIKSAVKITREKPEQRKLIKKIVR